MKTSPEKPPNYEAILKVFDVADKPVVFTYGETLFNVPDGAIVPPHLMVHEEIHMKQQGDDPVGWWDKYLVDKQFRFEQELQAYAAQYKFVFDNTKRSLSDKFLDRFAHDMASEIYGNMCEFHEAHTAIRKLAKIII